MTKVELYKSRVFITIIHLVSLGQFGYSLWFDKFPKKAHNLPGVPIGLANKVKYLTYWGLLQSNLATKIWVEGSDLDSPNTWQSGYLPCSQDQIEFPESYSASILLPSSLKTAGITLPNDGALLFPLNSTTSFDNIPDNGRKCKNSNQIARIKSTPVRRWFDPDNWRDSSIDPNAPPNPAYPHILKIPCNQELVRIAATGPLSIQLHDINTLQVGQIELAGSNVSTEFMEQLFRSELGKIMFKDVSSTKVEYDKDMPCGCVEPYLLFNYYHTLCDPIKDRCKKPKCLDPIMPYGHCCPLCGSAIEVTTLACNTTALAKLKSMLDKSIKEQGMEDQLIYHAGIINSVFYTFTLQAVILDEDGYGEKSIQFIKHFNQSLDEHSFPGDKVDLHVSGVPYDPSGFGSVILLMVLTLLGVLSFFGVVFVNFAPDNGLVRLPRWMHVRWYDLFQSPFVFARFENTAAAEGEARGNIVIDVQQYNVPTESEERATGTSTSFDNPMFVDNAAGNSSPQEDDDIPLCEEELTEIDLGTEVEGKL